MGDTIFGVKIEKIYRSSRARISILQPYTLYIEQIKLSVKRNIFHLFINGSFPCFAGIPQPAGFMLANRKRTKKI